MNTALTLIVAAAVAAATTFAVTTLRSDRANDAPPLEVAAHTRQLEELKKANEDLAASLRRLEERLAVPAASAPARTEVPAISEAAIDAALARHLARLDPEAATKLAAGAPKKGGEAFDAKAVFAQLTTGPRVFGPASEALWRKAREAGKVDELVGLFEQRAKENPGIADAQVELGNAYLQRLFAGSMGPEAGVWGTKADKSFDAALELDPNHWEARFQKAVSLSNWPDFLGKKPEAVKHLEILIGQQERGGVTRPEHAQSYLILANLYQQQGKEDKAKALWAKGASLFPDNPDLRKRNSGQ